MNIEDKERLFELKKQQYNQITCSLQIPNNIIQFGQPGYYPECLINEFIGSYCQYCGDLICPCDYFMNIEAKRQYSSNINNNNNNSNINNNNSNNNSNNNYNLNNNENNSNLNTNNINNNINKNNGEPFYKKPKL